jgi:hypothetical protein
MHTLPTMPLSTSRRRRRCRTCPTCMQAMVSVKVGESEGGLTVRVSAGMRRSRPRVRTPPSLQAQIRTQTSMSASAQMRARPGLTTLPPSPTRPHSPSMTWPLLDETLPRTHGPYRRRGRGCHPERLRLSQPIFLLGTMFMHAL